MAEAEADGDRFIEIISAGALYLTGDWERKYWSCSRGKDRYPYPVGYHAVRHFSGISYAMEILQGPRGPVFQVTSTQGDSSTGPTPDIAWKNFHKKTAPKVRNWQRMRSFPQKIDGVELFGFKNASVQRLLRELLVSSTCAVELSLPRPVTSDADSPLAKKAGAVVSDGPEDLPFFFDKTGGTAKRSVNPSQEEGSAKRVHYQDISPSADNCNNELDIAADEGSNELQDVTGSKCSPPLLEEITCNSKHTLIDDNLGELIADSSQQVDLSSSSYLSSEKSDLESAVREVARSMMTILLPEAIPLLKKTQRKKKVKSKKNEDCTVSNRTSTENPSADGCQGAAVCTSIGEKTNVKVCQTYFHGEPLSEMVKDSCANDDGMIDEPDLKSDDSSAFVADSFENAEQIQDDNTSKPIGAHHNEYNDDACSKESYEHPKVTYDNREDHNGRSEYQMEVHDGIDTPDVVYDHEKGQYVLSDSLLACLEEEFGEKDDSYPAKYNQSDVEQIRVKQQFEDPTSGINNGSSILVDVSDQNNFGSGLIDGCLQDSDKHKRGILSNGESLTNVLSDPVHSDACNNNDKMSKFDDAEFVDKFVAFDSSGAGNRSKYGTKLVKAVTEWPVDDGTKAGKGNQNESKTGRRNGNENTVVFVGCPSNVCDQVPPKGKHNVLQDHALPDINHSHGPLWKYNEASPRLLNHHLDLMGCYLHPMPVLSIVLNTKNYSSLLIYALCGFLESCQRFLYVYNIILKGQQETAPHFVGYTPFLLPSLEQSCTGNVPFERSGLQFTPDGQFLVLLGHIRIPFCRRQNIDCSCSLCKLDQCESNCLKVVSVDLGYVSLLTKLMAYGTLSCILTCEPNYIVTVEDGRKLHIWMMAAGWSIISEDYVIPSLGNMGPSILELRRMPKGSTLIIGHDGAGKFCIWDISKRTLMATFTAPGLIVFQILPVVSCSFQEDIILASVSEIKRRLHEITASDVSRKADKESILMSTGKDAAIWILISSASVAEYQSDLRAKEHNARWRLALLANKTIFMGNILDTRATVVDASGNHGFAGTYGGFLYMWELSSGRKLVGTQCFNRGRVSCIAVDAKSGLVAVADDGGQLLLYSQNKVASNPRSEGNMFRTK